MLAIVLGGARSGKSAVAERLTERLAESLPAGQTGPALPVIYLAPGQAFDQEMADRIGRHRQRRNPAWLTVEEPVQIAAVVRAHGAPDRCLLLDGLGIWISNLLLAEQSEEQILAGVADLLAAVRERSANLVIVSDETGLGVIPPSPLGRLFRDCLGRANQMVTARADRALFVAAGIPIDLKALEVEL